MKSIFEKFLRGSLFLVLSMLFVTLQGCPLIQDGLNEGSAYEVEIQVLEDGTLYAVEIEPSDDGEQDGENEDGENDADSDSDSDSDSDGDEDGEDIENVDMGFSVQVDTVAADCSSFTVFRSLIVVLEADEDEDGEDELGICDLTAGMWIEVEGEYGADGIFVAEEIETADEAETEIEAVLENLTEGTFMMLGLVITYDENTVIEAGDEEEDEGEGEDDDVGCEQEGENEGENAGC